MSKTISLLFFLLFFSSLFSQELYDINRIPEIRITFQERNWDYKLDSMKRTGNNPRLIAEVTIDGEKFNNVGVRYKGNSSYFNVEKSGSSKLPFNLKASHANKEQRFPGGYETIKLSNIFRDPSFVREALSYEIARKYMPAPKCNFAKVYVNDKYLGLYNNTESVDEHFLKENFGKHKNTFVKCDPDWGAEEFDDCPEGDKASLMYLGDDPSCYAGLYEMKSNGEKDWEKLIDVTKVVNQEPEKLEEALNIDKVLWMHAFNNVLVNLDSYTGRLSHNYYLYKTPDGLFTPLVWDMNLSFGGFRFDGISPRMLTDEDMQTLSPLVHYKTKNAKRPLIVNVFSNTLFRKMYLGHMRTILMENFTNDLYLERAKEIQTTIQQAVLEDENKLYSYESFEKNVEKTTMAGKSKIIGISQLMKKRVEYLLKHPLLSKAPPPISNVRHEQYEGNITINATIEGAQKAWLFYRSSSKKAFKRLEMYDDGANLDEMQGDNIWGMSVEYKKGMQYYVVGEGSRNASFSPARASFEFYTIE